MKMAITCVALLATLPMAGAAQSIDYGDDASQWSRDGECDDRRFRGKGMAEGLDRDDVGHDASDCRAGVERGDLRLWIFDEARAVTQCDAIDYGDDSGEWANDGACDDYRFEGPGADYVQLLDDIGVDASDCRTLCAEGKIALRDY